MSLGEEPGELGSIVHPSGSKPSQPSVYLTRLTPHVSSKHTQFTRIPNLIYCIHTTHSHGPTIPLKIQNTRTDLNTISQWQWTQLCEGVSAPALGRSSQTRLCVSLRVEGWRVNKAELHTPLIYSIPKIPTLREWEGGSNQYPDLTHNVLRPLVLTILGYVEYMSLLLNSTHGRLLRSAQQGRHVCF